MNETLSDLMTLERAGWDALCASRGDEFYGNIMTPYARMILVGGMVLDRDGVIASLKHAPAWDGYEISDEEAITLNPHTTILTYRGHSWREDGGELDAIMASTYVWHRGEWKLALYQQTAIATPD